MGGCREDIGSPAVRGGRVWRMVKEVDIRQEVSGSVMSSNYCLG